MTLSVDPKGNDFVLRRTDSNGTVAEIDLSDEDVLSLSQSAQLLRNHILSKRSPAGGTVSAAFVTSVVQVGLAPDLLGENVLLTMVASSGAQVTFSLPLYIVDILVDRLPVHRARAAVKTPTTCQ